VTTTRRGWRAALDSSLLFVVCGSVTALLTAAPAAAVVAGRTMAVASPVVESRAVAPFESNAWLTDTSESTPRDSAEEADDDNDDDDDVLEHSLSQIPARGLETWLLTRTDRDPSVSLESDGHSLRAPPR
jgi:hypothetical protein